jgi:UBX domain-containing protein 1/4
LIDAAAPVAMRLRCGECEATFATLAEAKAHGASTGHENFAAADDDGRVAGARDDDDADDDDANGGAEPTTTTTTGDDADGARAMDTGDDVKMIEPKVREDLLLELTELMGFGRHKAIRALHFSGADSSERAIDWIERHEEDADINEPLLIEDPEHTAKKVKTVSKLTPEEAKKKADELRRNAAARKAERLLEEAEMERLREQERIRSGKELLAAKKLEDDLSLKRNAEARAAEKKEMDKAREAIRVKIEEDRKERRRKLGLPEELTPEEQEEERKREEERARVAAEELAKKAANGLYVKPVSKLENLRKHLVDIKKAFAEDTDAVTTCFNTLLVYLGNVSRAPDEEKFRSIKMSNAAFQKRVAAVGGEIYLIEFGFKETTDADGEKRLVLAREDVDQILLKTAGEELHGAMNNPFFGML